MNRYCNFYITLIWLCCIPFSANGMLTTDILTIPSGKDYMRVDSSFALFFDNSLNLDIHQDGADTGLRFFEPAFNRLSPNTQQPYDFIIERRETVNLPKIEDGKTGPYLDIPIVFTDLFERSSLPVFVDGLEYDVFVQFDPDRQSTGILSAKANPDESIVPGWYNLVASLNLIADFIPVDDGAAFRLKGDISGGSEVSGFWLDPFADFTWRSGHSGVADDPPDSLCCSPESNPDSSFWFNSHWQQVDQQRLAFSVPEPPSLALLIAGLLAMSLAAPKRK